MGRLGGVGVKPLESPPGETRMDGIIHQEPTTNIDRLG
jgi:hypothetical protein